MAKQQQLQLKVPEVVDNPDGWGPPDDHRALQSQLQNVPYAPFNKGEKLGRASDWTRNVPARYAGYGRGGGGGNDYGVFDYFFDEADEESFRLVDGKPPPRPKFGPRWRFQQKPQLPQRKDEEEARRREAEKERQRRDKFYNQNRNMQRRESATSKSSVDIQPDWAVLEQIPFSTFAKLNFHVGEAEDLALCGALEFYDKTYDRVTSKSERRLERFKNRNFFKVTTTDDPVIRRLASEDMATVFATDSILATLMCAPRSVYSWDIVVQRVGNKLFFDKRDGSQLDMLTVHETAQESLPESKDDINSAQSLSVEATFINQNFSQQVCNIPPALNFPFQLLWCHVSLVASLSMCCNLVEQPPSVHHRLELGQLLSFVL
jgi:translation initiation factor 3 subunit D